MFNRLVATAFICGVGIVETVAFAQNSPPPCLPGTTAYSEVYGYSVGYRVPGQIDLCHTTFRTLEEAEYALHNDPRGPSFQVGELAFLVLDGASFFSSPANDAALDYRPHGATKMNAGVLIGPPDTLETSHSLFVTGWPPTSQSIEPACATELQACSAGSVPGWCPSVDAQLALAECQFDHTWKPNSEWYWQRTGSAVSAGEFSDITSVSVSPSDPAVGVLHYSPNSSLDPAWGATLEITAIRGGNNLSQGATATASDTRTFKWNRERRDDFSCPAGETANTAASGAGNACETGMFKSFITGPSLQQNPQCGVGNPCVPGNGNKMVHERGFRWGNIDFDLYYNSLRQLRPYAYIDRNWSHSFATRLLTEWGQDHLHSAEYGIGSVSTVYIQNARAQLEAYQRISSSTPGVFRSTYSVGDILRYQAATATVAAQWLLSHPDGSIEVFDRAGRLSAILHPDDPRQDLTLEYLLPGQMDDPATDIDTDTDHLEEQFWRVNSVTDGTGRSVSFVYTDPQFFWLSSIIADDGTLLMHFTYDAEHRLTHITRPGGVRTFLYNEPENIGSGVPSYITGYWLTGILDEDNRRYATYQYDNWGRAIASWHGIDAGKVSITYPEDANGNPADDTAIVTMPSGATRTYNYNTAQPVPYRQPDSIVEGGGQSAFSHTTLYDPTTRRVSQVTDSRGTITQYQYETSASLRGVHETARIEALGEPEQRRIETDWDSTINRVSERRLYSDPANSGAGTLETRTTFNYTATGQLVSRIQHDSSKLRARFYEYCQAVAPATGCAMVGLLHSIDGPRADVSDVTTFEYFGATVVSGCAAGPLGACHRKGDLQRTINAEGHVIQYLSYDRAGRLTRQQDSNGVLTDFYYHPRGWLQKRVVRARPDGMADADDATTRFVYDMSGNLTAVTQPDGVTLHYAYDDAHRLVDVVDNVGNRIHYELDAAGHRVAERTYDSSYNPSQPQQGLKREISRVYNLLGRIHQVLDANEVETRIYDPSNGYDGNGNPIFWADGLGTMSANDYDPLNRLVTTWRGFVPPYGASAQTEFTYDARDHLRAVTDPGGLTTTYTYTAFGDLIQLDSPDTGITAYTYDGAGNRTTQIDARGVTTTYSYDAINRLVAVGYPDASLDVTYVYDQPNSTTGCLESHPTGRLTQMTDASGVTVYCYDRRGNITRKQHVTKYLELTITMTYTLADRISSITYPSGATVSYNYGTLGRITTVIWTPAPGAAPVLLIASATYLPFGPLGALTFGNGIGLDKNYDQNYAIDSIASTVSGGLTLDLDVGVMGNIVSASNALAPPQPARTYAYDPLYRLTDVVGSAGPLAGFTYNKTGDRLSATGNGSMTGTYTYVPGTHRLNDVAGVPRTYDANGNTLTGVKPGKSLSYADHNRLTGVSSLYASTGYMYNGRGERVLKRYWNSFMGEVTTHYAYNESGQLLGWYDDNAMPIAEYIYLGTLPVGVIKQGMLYYILTDHLGTPRQVIEPVRNVPIWQWDFLGSAFGANAPDEDPDGDGTTFILNLRFPGQYYDAESGLHYNYFRDYEAGTGRYVESDPIGLRSDINTYRYAYSNPLLVFDPTGLKSWFCRKSFMFAGFIAMEHHSLCTKDPAGKMRCGSLSPKPDCSVIDKLSGKCEGDDGNDQFDPERCELIGDDECFDKCIFKRLSGPRPNYVAGPTGMDCQEWVDDVWRSCAWDCNLPVPLN